MTRQLDPAPIFFNLEDNQYRSDFFISEFGNRCGVNRDRYTIMKVITLQFKRYLLKAIGCLAIFFKYTSGWGLVIKTVLK